MLKRWRWGAVALTVSGLALASVGVAHGQGLIERLTAMAKAPAVKPTEILIAVPAPGASPAEVEQLVALPLEEAVRGVQGVASLISRCVEGQASVRVSLEPGADLDVVRMALRLRLESTWEVMPEFVERPIVQALYTRETTGWLIFEGGSPEARREALFRARMREGAAGEPCDGGRGLVKVKADPKRLVAYGLQASDITDAVLVDQLSPSEMLNIAPAEVGPEALAKIPVAADRTPGITVGDLAEIVVDLDPAACRCFWRGEPAACAPLHRAFTLNSDDVPAGVKGQARTVQASWGVRVTAPEGDPWPQIRGWASLKAGDVLMEVEQAAGSMEARLWPLAKDEEAARAWISHCLEEASRSPGIHATPLGSVFERQQWSLTGGTEGARAQALDAIRAWARLGGQRRIVDIEGGASKPEIELDLDRKAMGRLGLTSHNVSRQLRLASSGQTLIPGGPRTPAVVLAMKGAVERPEDIAQVMISTPAGQRVPLGAVARVTLTRAAASRLRVDSQPATLITIWGEGLKSDALSAAVTLPAGVTLVRLSATPARARR